MLLPLIVSFQLVVDFIDALSSKMLGEPGTSLSHSLGFVNFPRAVIVLLISVLDLFLVKTFKFLLQHDFCEIPIACYHRVELLILIEFTFDGLNRHLF